MKFVDISGFGHSGKSVITDLLKEFKGYQVPHYNFEFNLLRIQGGLLDLKFALHDNWSPIRSDAAIRRFQRLVRRIGPSANLSRPLTLAYSNGMNYDNAFQGKFSEITRDYIGRLIRYSYRGEWPYIVLDQPVWKQFLQRILLNFRIKKSFLSDIYVTEPDNFIPITVTYLEELFGLIKEEQTTCIVTHNAVEPFNPTEALEFFKNGKVVIVQRDPRDIYASTLIPQKGYIPEYEISRHWQIKGSFLEINNLDRFIERQKLLYERIRLSRDNNKVLRLRYEDVVLNYERTVTQILEFLNESPEIHFKKKTFFNPDQSKKNIGLWKSMENQESIRRIQEALPEFCFQ
ncbi:MAG: sulfotransferase domain-containing protein [Chitinophagaceae bacterium]|nr:sulfotransferase domain-containing protein [Chitinophagaceae bacterium]MCA6459671.1 sulfotransferase domain-containing protein [Chitinophagaceae bacterium]MCA6464538.1 sulfotransferase domain-containing protein [Chitinophagaceae bacterium]